MSVVGTRIFAPKWMARIVNEGMQSLAGPEASRWAKLTRRRDLMHEACPEWEVPQVAWQPLEG